MPYLSVSSVQNLAFSKSLNRCLLMNKNFEQLLGNTKRSAILRCYVNKAVTRIKGRLVPDESCNCPDIATKVSLCLF